MNGKLTNIYSHKDYVLKYMFHGVMSKVAPIGTMEIFNEINEVEKEEFDNIEDYKLSLLKKAINIDCTVECPGHAIYSDFAYLIHARTPYSI